MIRSDVQEAVVATLILDTVRFQPGYKPELLTYQATQAAKVQVAPPSKWSML